jgi:hypothetical protein
MHATFAAAIMALLLYLGRPYINSHPKVIQNGHLGSHEPRSPEAAGKAMATICASGSLLRNAPNGIPGP